MPLPRLKVVVFGTYHAGKSTLIRALDPEARHVEARKGEGSTTVALDFGRVRLEGAVVYLFGTPGQERFGFAREILTRGMDAAILLVDAGASDHALIDSLRIILNEKGVPYAIFLNKCDRAEGNAERLMERFRGEMCYPVSALLRINVRESLEAFVSEVLAGVGHGGREALRTCHAPEPASNAVDAATSRINPRSLRRSPSMDAP